MNLTEGQLFTIEALNRIEGFVWPEKAKFASMDAHRNGVDFYHSAPQPIDGEKSFGLQFWLQGFSGKFISEKINPDWRNSLITREEFESVDGWVNINGNAASSMDALIDVMLDGGLIVSGVTYSDALLRHQPFSKWRYHKPTKETEMKDDEEFSLPISDVYLRYKAQRETTADARKALEASMEAEDKLLEQIKAWNLEYGFDIRVLDESDWAPDLESESELVITDWRDLRVGDVVWWSGAGCIDSGEYAVSTVESNDYKGSTAFCVSCAHGLEWVSTKFEKWKFIRRPSK